MRLPFFWYENNLPFLENKPPGYWQDSSNCRTYFESLAKQEGFNPLKEDNWYGKPYTKDIFMKAAVQRAYPELTFTKWTNCKPPLSPLVLPYFCIHVNFVFSSNWAVFAKKGRWEDVQNVRMLFDWYAGTQGFDPLDTSAWYNVTTLQLLGVKVNLKC